MNLVEKILNRLDEQDPKQRKLTARDVTMKTPPKPYTPPYREKIGKTPFTKATGGKTTAPRDDFRSSPKSPKAGLPAQKLRKEFDFPGSSSRGGSRSATVQREREPKYDKFSPATGHGKGHPKRVKAEAPVKASLAKRWEAKKKEKGLK